MEGKKSMKCSLCGENDHNKWTCPQKPIEDTFIREDDTYVTEEIIINPKRELLIRDLLDSESYDIDNDLFRYWIQVKRPIQLKELKYVMDTGLSRDSLKLYLELSHDIDSYY